ncbi:reticulon-4-interacting protein 1, mitochondrial-like isoform X2 [Anthonomus grandis grandis]|uniref:reticulon-4-interacting protein 1, mitochondrial-like isoform X2 n=1 Tax=Anthonomus grandis grandis TaxID=2921223 RepID=UPI002165A24E|nr:reticulon-4-interacting protein 1, mitochondrial-like isoform X2 [Anthonomus grandis grandis]
MRWLFLGSRREVGIACISFVIGGAVGLGVGLIIRRRETIYRYMEAIQISHYLGPEGATVVEDAHAPYECGQHDVLVEVKASSVQIIDAQICCGYGRTFRRILRRIYKQSSSDLPVILGRDCTGVITDLGKSVKRLEIGDEVWVTVPFWSQGTLCQTVLVSEARVARKPKNVGFEGACSIPYAGSLALSALTEANIDFSNAKDKRFLIQDGCTPVGCVLIQLLNNWRARVTTTCYKRALPVAKALGATDIITIDDSHYVRDVHEKDPQEIREGDQKLLLKELEVRGETFDVIVLTRNDCVDLSGFCTKNGRILCTAPEELLSDSCGFFSRLLLTGYVKLKIVIQNTLGLPSDTFDEAHLCHATLDRLTEMVEDGVLQTVVEKVYHPKDIEVALNHVQSPHSIGSTVVTFR